MTRSLLVRISTPQWYCRSMCFRTPQRRRSPFSGERIAERPKGLSPWDDRSYRRGRPRSQRAAAMGTKSSPNTSATILKPRAASATLQCDSVGPLTMGLHLVSVTVDGRAVDPGPFQMVVQQHPQGRARFAVDKAHQGPSKVGYASDIQGVSPRPPSDLPPSLKIQARSRVHPITFARRRRRWILPRPHCADGFRPGAPRPRPVDSGRDDWKRNGSEPERRALSGRHERRESRRRDRSPSG